MDTATLRNETTSGVDLPQLVAQGRAAYEHKRTKECLDLTKQVLLADPDNADAKALQAAVSTDIQRDLTDARALLEDAERMEDGHKYRKAAEIILLKILYLDPLTLMRRRFWPLRRLRPAVHQLSKKSGLPHILSPSKGSPGPVQELQPQAATDRCRHCPSRRRVMVLQIASARHGRRAGAGGTGGHFGRACSRNYRRYPRHLCSLWKFEHLPQLILRRYPARFPFLLFPQVSRSLR